MTITKISRRGFLKYMTIAGVTIYLAPLHSKAYAALFNEKVLETPNWDPKTKTIRHRTDAMAKITGDKVFAIDIRSRDLPHWPQEQAHAFILRATEANRDYQGFDLSLLKEKGLMPDRIVTSEDLAQDDIAFTPFYGDDPLLPKGKKAAYLGHAVAIFIFNDFARFKFAKDALKFRNDIVQYGPATGYLQRDPWGTFRAVRIGGETPFDADIYSSLKDTKIFPLGMQKHLPVWPEGREGGKLNEQGMYYAEQLANEMKNPPEDWLVLNKKFHSPSNDMAALEPESTNGWFDAATRSLHLVVGTQSPIDVVDSLAKMMEHSAFPLKNIFLHPCSTVGYGTKEHSNFSFYGAIASIYSNGKPVRLANDRYEHFQTSLKRHSFDMEYSLAINKKTHKIESFIGHFVGDGGGRSNFTPGVISVAAVGTQGIYYIPKSDLTSIGIASRAVDAGSTRGYGTLQTMTAFDTLMDEAAKILKADPIEFRLNNLRQSGTKSTQGTILAGKIRGKEVLTTCAQHPIWTERAQRKIAFERDNPGKLFATGISCVQKSFGTGSESAFARIELSRDGKVMLYHSGPEIGTGMSSSQAVLCARWFGIPADRSKFAETDWALLPMFESANPYAVSQEEQDRLSEDPLWTPAYCSPASASNSAFYYSHITLETGRLLFDYGIWPAALSIWQDGIGGGQAAPFTVRKEDARWTEEGLSANGMEPLSLERIAERIYQRGGLTGAVSHGFNRWEWANADFNIDGEITNRPLDGISLRWGDNTKYEVNKRVKINFPSTQRNHAGTSYSSAMATTVELSINKVNGNINVLNHHSVSECGKMIVPELVYGQIEGGVAQGIGYALYEYLPLYENGPGNGTWNFNRYRLPKASEVAVWDQTHEVLPPVSETDPAKGMAEVVMIPVASAINNAIADATGHYFSHYPILPENILEVLKK